MRPHWKLTQLYTISQLSESFEKAKIGLEAITGTERAFGKMSRSLLSLGIWDRGASSALMASGLAPG